jgi:alpha-tubulin suppressor-like RCC1 family protein
MRHRRSYLSAALVGWLFVVLERTVPVQVSGLTNVMAIATGHYHSLALRSDGTVWAWGFSDEGQLGDGSPAMRLTPVQVMLP